MNGIGILDLLKTNMQAAMPDQLVTRDALDFAQRDEATCKKGVITILSESVTGLDAVRDLADLSGKLSIYVVYEFRRAENTKGSVIEAEEWRFAQALIDFITQPGAGLCPLDISEFRFSQQRTAPDGWVFAPLTYSELD